MNDEGLTEEEYFTLYNARYYSSNLDNGYFCLAISPDTTRILAGTNDAEIYVIDSTTLKVLLCKRAYGFCKTVTGCHYNPLSGHEEFAVCNEIGVFDIWNVTTLDDGSEEASKIHHLKFPPGTSNCVYSPDGQFIALTSGKESKTYIISSTSAKVMFTLLYPAPEDSSYNTYFCASSLFFGNSCQVATYHDDHVICLWKLPVIYSLKTLCLIFLRASIKYNDIEELCVPTSLKQRLKYLYV
jgi:WD40 repeat protein